MKPPSLTLGIEEEYQIIDPETRELKSYITQILEQDHLVLSQVKPELHQSIVEVGTKVCKTPADVRAELRKLRREVIELTAKNGLRIAAAGTHPFSHWAQQEVTPLERYLGLREAMGELAQRLLIFGTHVHIGIEDRTAYEAMKVGAARNECIELVEVAFDGVDRLVLERELKQRGGVATSHARDDGIFACQRNARCSLLQPGRRRGAAAEAIGIQGGIPISGNVAQAHENPLKSRAS